MPPASFQPQSRSHDRSVADNPIVLPVDLAGPDARIDSARLLQGRRELLIRHGSEYYRLRHTRNGKLILTK